MAAPFRERRAVARNGRHRRPARTRPAPPPLIIRRSSLIVHRFPARARWLDPLAGAWLNPDPIFDDLRNTYRFVGNDPVNHTDPTGLSGKPTFARWLEVRFDEYVVNPIDRLMMSGGGKYSQVMAQHRDQPRTGWWWSHVPTAQELRFPEFRSESVLRREAREERARELRLRRTPEGIRQLSDEDVARVSRQTLAREWWSRVVPGLAQYRSGCELWTGRDQYTGERLTAGGRLSAAADFIPGGRGVGKVADQSLGAARRASRAALGRGSSLDELVRAAQKQYPTKAGQIEQHHIVPLYLGGARGGPTVSLDAAYHQLITNEFRRRVPYGSEVPSAALVREIMQEAYEKYPLPPPN